MRRAALVIAMFIAGCATTPPAPLVLPSLERTNLEQDEYDEIAAQLPGLIGCLRARRPGCGLEEDYLEYFEPDDIEPLFGSRRVDAIWYHPDHKGSGTIEITMHSDAPGAQGVISFVFRGGRWRPDDAAMEYIDPPPAL